MATQISSLTTLVNGVNSYDCFLPLVDPTLALDSRNLKVRISTHNEMFSNNFAVASLSSYGNYFGTGKDGSLTISSSAQVSASLNNISREFGDTIVKNYQNLTINSGVLFSPLRACRGMVIYCTGNLTVNGTISMTGKGGGVVNKIASPIGIASSTDSRYDLIDATLYFNNFSSSTAGGYGIPTHWNWAPSGSIWFSNYKTRVAILSGSVAGGAGASSSSSGGSAGSAGIFCCGGGGGGGSGEAQYGTFGSGAAGGRGTIFAGGGGGGGGTGGCCGGGAAGTTGLFERGGAGASTGTGVAGGGAGTIVSGGNGTLGAGGLLILIVRGNVTINGTISSNGSNGGGGTNISKGTGGGGGSGGGRIIIVYGGTYSNAGSVVTNGGSAGPAGPVGGPGAAGGAGSITTRKVHI
jgi:hypothetical protein